MKNFIKQGKIIKYNKFLRKENFFIIKENILKIF